MITDVETEAVDVNRTEMEKSITLSSMSSSSSDISSSKNNPGDCDLFKPNTNAVPILPKPPAVPCFSSQQLQQQQQQQQQQLPTVTTVKRKRRSRFASVANLKHGLMTTESTKNKIKNYLDQKAATSLSSFGTSEEQPVAGDNPANPNNLTVSSNATSSKPRQKGRPRRASIAGCQVSKPGSLFETIRPGNFSEEPVNTGYEALMALSTAASNLDSSLSPSYALKASSKNTSNHHQQQFFVPVSPHIYELMCNSEVQKRFNCDSPAKLVEFSFLRLLGVVSTPPTPAPATAASTAMSSTCTNHQ